LSRTARSIGASLFTEADTVEELRAAIREAVQCHFDRPADRPTVLRTIANPKCEGI
jgi:hypothetical protein